MVGTRKWLALHGAACQVEMMQRIPLVPLAALATVTVLCQSDAGACYWDYDTLAMEKRSFPGTLELITGKFLRHSDDFYRWRVTNRLAQLKDRPDELALYDDLAVAYDKLGQHREAIDTMLAKSRRPGGDSNGLYETHANLGTFHLHAGEFEKGLEHIRKAIAINPDAHFGREVIQLRLVEYVMQQQARSADRDQARISLPLGRDWVSEHSPVSYAEAESSVRGALDRFTRETPEPTTPWIAPLFEAQGFARHVIKQGHGRDEAMRGVLGMMKFASHRSPILLEALGDLLLWDYRVKESAKQLAARAYLEAAQEAGDPDSAELYRVKAILALVGQRNISLAKLERQFKTELTQARKWFDAVAANERRWIRQGKDPEAEFDRRYYRKR